MNAEQKYLALYDQYLDESDATKRLELILQMQEIKRVNGWIL